MKSVFNSVFSFVSFVLLLILNVAYADSAGQLELQQRMNKLTEYRADFEQIVRTKQGNLVQKSVGLLQIKRPNLFKLETLEPQQNTIISDGKTLWFFDPFVAQVTASWVKDAVENTPFILLTSNDPSHWQQYQVTQKDDNFILVPKQKMQLKQFEIRIDKQGILKGFSTIENDGQSNLYALRNINTAELSNKIFQFDIPKGVQLDDQRK